MTNPQMNKPTASLLGLPLVLSALVVVIGLGIYFFSGNRWSSKVQPYDQVLSIDRKNLSDPKATDAEIFGALVRLAQKNEVIAKTEALQRKGNASATVREGCAAALGYFEEPATVSTLIDFLKDKEPKVRVRAIEALSSHWSEVRQAALEGFLKTGALPVPEKIALYTGLAKMSPNSRSRAEAMENLLKIARGGQDISGPYADLATSYLLSLSPTDEAVLDLLRDIVKKGVRTQNIPIAVRHLSAAGDSWIRGNLGLLAKNPNDQVRLAAIQSLHLGCPNDRWDILRAVLSTERDLGVLRAAIAELTIMPGDTAKNLAIEMPEHRKFDSDESIALRRAVAELTGNKGVDPCLREMMGRPKS